MSFGGIYCLMIFNVPFITYITALVPAHIWVINDLYLWLNLKPETCFDPSLHNSYKNAIYQFNSIHCATLLFPVYIIVDIGLSNNIADILELAVLGARRTCFKGQNGARIHLNTILNTICF